MVGTLVTFSGVIGSGHRRLSQAADAILDEMDEVKGKPGTGKSLEPNFIDCGLASGGVLKNDVFTFEEVEQQCQVPSRKWKGKSGLYFVVAKSETVLFSEGKSWDVLSTVKKGDMFLVQGCAQDFGGWRMLRVLDGGALQVDFVQRSVFQVCAPWNELSRRRKNRIGKGYFKGTRRGEKMCTPGVKATVSSGVSRGYRRSPYFMSGQGYVSWDEDVRRMRRLFELSSASLDMHVLKAALTLRKESNFAFAASQVFCSDGEYVEDESDCNVFFDVKEYQQVQSFEELVCDSESSTDEASEDGSFKCDAGGGNLDDLSVLRMASNIFSAAFGSKTRMPAVAPK